MFVVGSLHFETAYRLIYLYVAGESLAMQREIDKTSKLAVATSSSSNICAMNMAIQVACLHFSILMEHAILFGLISICVNEVRCDFASST